MTPEDAKNEMAGLLQAHYMVNYLVGGSFIDSCESERENAFEVMEESGLTYRIRVGRMVRLQMAKLIQRCVDTDELKHLIVNESLVFSGRCLRTEFEDPFSVNEEKIQKAMPWMHELVSYIHMPMMVRHEEDGEFLVWSFVITSSNEKMGELEEKVKEEFAEHIGKRIVISREPMCPFMVGMRDLRDLLEWSVKHGIPDMPPVIAYHMGLNPGRWSPNGVANFKPSDREIEGEFQPTRFVAE